MTSKKILFALAVLTMVFSTGVAHSDTSFVFGGIERTYLLHVPSSYDGRTSVPLVVMLHGITQSAAAAEYFSGFSLKSDSEGFIVVYPQGAVFHFREPDWHIEQFADYSPNTGPDDVGFISELIDRVEREYKIDPRRIYIAGFSSGGFMAHLLGAELSDRIAAIAPVAGAVGSRTDKQTLYIPEPSQPLSVITFCGTADSTYLGKKLWNKRDSSVFTTLSVADSVAFWVKSDGCSTTPKTETSADGKVIKAAYSGGKNGTEVVLYTLVGFGHYWPTVLSSYNIAATDIIWDFFERHPKL